LHSKACSISEHNILHPPIALQRLDYQSGDQVLVHPSPRALRLHAPIPKNAAPNGPLWLDPLDCLASLTDPIPDPGQHLVRIFGWYSNKTRGLRKQHTCQLAPATSLPAATDAPLAQPDEQTLDDPPDEAWHRASRRTWARLIQKVYLADPLTCPRCGGTLRIIGFIDNPDLIEKILRHLKLWAPGERPRPPPPRCSRTLEPDEDFLAWEATGRLFDGID
jgi:hypothetical protein